MIYETGNSAKQWILADLDKRFGQAQVRILDLACGNGRIWNNFLETHKNIKVVGIDTDKGAIGEGLINYAGNAQIELRVLDAQSVLPENDFDAVTALSAIEHVVDRPAFLKAVWSALKSAGISYLNYDAGHFRSHNVKERLMVPISQVLASLGIEGHYMKRVDDALFRAQAEKQGFIIEAIKKHNLAPLKGFMRGAPEQSLEAWFDFEEKLNALHAPDELDKLMLSTTLLLKRP